MDEKGTLLIFAVPLANIIDVPFSDFNKYARKLI
jgi:hypothetical protein